jgi:pyruvate dehydrogenase E2 component (dihydrolipoamide acetyltransferase)
MKEMSGSSLCLSSLGHIGGTAFTPIINAPDVAILGVTRTQERPVRGTNDEIVWRQMLPLSLSYDHRLINGADAAKFVAFIGARLQDADIFAA